MSRVLFSEPLYTSRFQKYKIAKILYERFLRFSSLNALSYIVRSICLYIHVIWFQCRVRQKLLQSFCGSSYLDKTASIYRLIWIYTDCKFPKAQKYIMFTNDIFQTFFKNPIWLPLFFGKVGTLPKNIKIMYTTASYCNYIV